MTLRTKLTLAFALFAAAPVLAAILPVSRALSEALEGEYAGRLDQAARGAEAEYRRLALEAQDAARDLARGPEVEALARDRASPGFDRADAAGRAEAWMQARGLDVLAVSDVRAVVVSSGHLPARAGDADPELRRLFALAPAGHALPRTMARATADGVEPVLALVAWDEVPAADPPLRVVAGFALGARFAERVAALTGGEVRVAPAEEGAGPAPAAAAASAALLDRLFGGARARSRAIPIPSADAPLATITVTLPATGLARARNTVALALLAALVGAAAAAALVGHAVARRVTRPVEALADGARRVAAGELGARVDAPAAGEVGELVAAFNAMTGDLARTTARAATAERIAAWREVARRLAHEVKNPLTPVAMSVETLREAWRRRRPDFDEIFEESTHAIGEEVRRLTRIVDEFGRFARLPPPEPRPVAPGELVDAALALYGEGDASVRITRDVEAGLPPVLVDRDQLLQVLHNLVRNALDAVGSRGAVRVSARRDGDAVALAVADDGPGVLPEHLAHLFEPYFTTKEGGTGLGLAIAERIVKEHGGAIEAASSPGAGTTFTVRLPAAAA